MNAKEPHHWEIKIGLSSGLVPSGKEPLPEPIYDTDLCCHIASLSYNVLISASSNQTTKIVIRMWKQWTVWPTRSLWRYWQHILRNKKKYCFIQCNLFIKTVANHLANHYLAGYFILSRCYMARIICDEGYTKPANRPSAFMRHVY